MLKIAKVVVPIALNKEFDYSIPAKFRVKKGMRILVDFNGKKRLGIINNLAAVSQFKKIKPVIDILEDSPVLSKEHLNFAKSLSGIYPYPCVEFLFMMLPPYLRKPRKFNFEGKVQAGRSKSEVKARMRFIKADVFSQRYQLWKDIVKEKLKEGSVLICFPQLSYLLAAKELLEKDFPSRLQVIHSQKGEKSLFSTWKETRTNVLILGTRVSVFYYPRDLRLIVVEEENSPYYFQEEKPCYNLMDVVLALSQMKGADLILSADFPSLAAYKLIKDKKLVLEDKENSKPEIKVIGKPEFGKKRAVSPILIELLEKSVRDGKKGVVLWNKKGFARFISCASCGHTFKCAHCSGFLQMSLKSDEGICPYCQRKTSLPKICDQCNEGYLKNSGYGIERIESILKKNFPEVKIDSWQNQRQESQIILSTSKILSYLYDARTNFDNGFVLDIDSFLARSDYESTFAAFLYLKKLSFFFTGALYVFTNNKDYYLFAHLNKEWRGFYEAELNFRQELNLPPFGLITKITLRAKNKNSLLKRSQDLYNKLEKSGLEVYGPLEEIPFKLRDKFRYSLIVKTKRNLACRKTVKEEIKDFRVSGGQIAISLR